MTELNGFKIDKFNQFNLPEGVKYSICPLCSQNRKKKTDKCMTLHWDTGLGICHHCGESIQLHTYKKKNVEKVYIKPIWTNKTNLSDKVVKWFECRKISQNTLKLMKISEGKEWMPQYKNLKSVDTIQFNYFLNDELINIKYRGPEKSFKMFKDAEKIFYNLDLIRTCKECIIVEGEIDCLSFIEAGLYNCVSTPNGSTLHNVNLDYLDSSYEFFENKDKIYLGLDNDEPGQNVQKELIRRFGPEKCYLLDLEDCKDANEFIIKYGLERLRQVVEKAKPVPLENVITFKDIKNELHEFYRNGSKSGYKIGLESFDKEFSTYLKQFIVITGIPTHGKSDFVDQMIVGYNVLYNWKGAICSVENDPKYLHVDKLCRKYAGIRPKNHIELETDKWKLAEDRVNDYFYFIDFEDGYDLNKVLNKVAELVKRKGIKYFVIDPYNKIKLKESSNRDINTYTSDYLLTIDTFCRKYDVLGLIVAHPVKMGKINGITQEPDFYDIKGGGEWFDMSPHGLMVYRDFNRDLVKIKVLKCKFQNLGRNGAEIWFKWNSVNGRYTEIQGNPDDPMSPISCTFEYSHLLIKEVKQNYINFNQNIEPNYNYSDDFKQVDEIPF